MNLPYSVIGGCAAALWIATVDVGAIRATPNVDLMIDRAKTDEATECLSAAGFVYQFQNGKHLLLDGPNGKPRTATRLIFASERVKDSDHLPTPPLDESTRLEDYSVVTLAGLVRMKLIAHRLIERVHLRDLIGVGLIDASWPAKFQPELAARLQSILDNPDG